MNYPPGDNWQYMGQTTTAALVASGCNLFAQLPPPPSPAPALPTESCRGFPFALGFPRIGSKTWCQMEADILGGMKALGQKILQFTLNGLDAAEKFVWPWANTDLGACSTAVGLTSKGFQTGFLGVSDTLDFLKSFFSCIWSAFKWILGNLGYYTIRGLKFLVCGLLNAQNNPEYVDYLTAYEIWIVRYVWKTARNIRLSSPDYLGVQTIGADVEDYFSQVIDFLEKSVKQMHPPSVIDAMEAYLTGTIDTVQYECWMRLGGHSPGVFRPVLDSRREQLTTDEKIDFVRRQTLGQYGTGPLAALVTDGEKQQENNWQKTATKSMRTVGWIRPTDADNRYSLYDEIPTIADHLHWLARNVDDFEYLKDYHLLDGFDGSEVIASVMSADGAAYKPIPLTRNFWLEFGDELRSQGMRKIDAARHYAAHWLHPSPQQMHEFIYRLNPDRRREPWDDEVASYFQGLGYPPELVNRATTFTTDDFRRIMSEQDYGYLDVAWFLSTVYHVPALSYLRDMYRYNVFSQYAIDAGQLPADSTPEERQQYDDYVLGDYHRKLGYNELDSSLFVSVDRRIKARIRASESFGWTPGALSRAYGLGLVEKDYYTEQMQLMGFSTLEIENAQSRASVLTKERVLTRALGRVITRTITQVSNSYAQGVLDEPSATDALTGLGVDKDRAAAIIQMETLKTRTRLAGEVVRVTKSAFLKGKIDQNAAQTLLKQVNLSDEFISASVATWQLEILDIPKEATLGEIRRWVTEGLMGADEAKLRMTRLHIADADQQLILEELQQKIQAMQAKQQQAEQTKQEKQIAAAQKATAQAQRAVQAAIDKQKQSMPPRQLLKWVKEGLLSAQAMAAQLTVYGFTPEAVALWTSEAVIASGQPPAGAGRGPKPPPIPGSKTLSEAEVKKAYKDGVIDPPEFIARMTKLGYDYGSISVLATDAGRPLPGSPQQQGG